MKMFLLDPDICDTEYPDFVAAGCPFHPKMWVEAPNYDPDGVLNVLVVWRHQTEDMESGHVPVWWIKTLFEYSSEPSWVHDTTSESHHLMFGELAAGSIYENNDDYWQWFVGAGEHGHQPVEDFGSNETLEEAQEELLRRVRVNCNCFPAGVS